MVFILLIRGHDFCRACNSLQLFCALNLGNVPIANELLRKPEAVDSFPLQLMICKNCGLGQVPDVVSPTRLFKDYRYLSSISTTFLNHAEVFAHQMIKQIDWEKGDWVLEIASNDGYLLSNFISCNIDVLGIEPAGNIATIARARGVPTENVFFSSEYAKALLIERGHPKLIIANNVFAHVPDIRDFTLGLSILSNHKTLISIENPSILNLLENLQFDSIYHEHFSYLSTTSVSFLAQQYELTLFNLEKIPTHGGSNRYWLRKGNSFQYPVVSIMKNHERARGLLSPKAWKEFSTQISKIIEMFRSFVDLTIREERFLIGYGAAAKASTLLNVARVKSQELKYIIDESPEKIGRFMPSANIPIVSFDTINKEQIDDIIIFPWNIAEELATKLRGKIGSRTRLWKTIPSLVEI